MTEAATSEGSPGKRGWPLHVKILLGLIIGSVLGLTANYLAHEVLGPDTFRWVNAESPPTPVAALDWLVNQIVEPIGKIFLRLILMMVIPLVVSALALGVLELGDVRKLGRVGLKTLGYTLLLSSMAVAIGLALVNTVRPGDRLPQEQREQLAAKYHDKAASSVTKSKQAKSLRDTLLDIIPENPLQEAVGALDGSSKGNGMLSVMFFALVLGTALAMGGPRTEPLARLLESLFDVSMFVISLAMKIAPVCVACLLFSITAQLGGDILTTLGWFVAVALVGMILQVVVVYSLAVWLFAGRNPRRFFADISEAMLYAFSTSSSNATLPTALRVAHDKLKLPPEISQFVLTIGSTANQNGTALYEGIVVLFLAQVYGVDLSVGQQITVVLMSVLAGIGTAGVPGGSIPMIVIVLQTVGVPGESIGIILGVDRILDMSRTVLNVAGDLVLASCVSGRQSDPRAGMIS